MSHQHVTPEEQVTDFRTHLREDHEDPEPYKGVTAKGLILTHARYHPDHRVVEFYKGTLEIR